HGGLNRADTFNNIVAVGPDFKTGFKDLAPVSNADIAQTIAYILRVPLKPGKNSGRVLSEALQKQNDYQVEYSFEVESSEPTKPNAAHKSFRTVLHYQKLIERQNGTADKEYRYYDQACLVTSENDADNLNAKCKYSNPIGLGNGKAAEIGSKSGIVQEAL